MERIPVRELNQHTSAVLARVAGGQTVEITVNGRLTARLVPVGDQADGLEDLVRRGRIIPATDSGPIPLPPGRPDVLIDSTEIVSDLRDERL